MTKALFPAIALVAACATADAGESVLVTDSAGVEIVQNLRPAAGAAWMLTAEPTVDIGGSEDEPEYDFLYINGARRLDDGSIVLANGGSSELRMYDSDGVYLRTLGKEGEGPGEFRGVTFQGAVAGDSIFAYDFQLRRLTAFSRQGDLLATISNRVNADRSFITPVARLMDGRWLARVQQFFTPNSVDGVRRDSLSVVMVSSGLDSVLDTVGTFAGTEMLVQTGGSGGNRFVSIRSVPLGLNTSIAHSAGQVVVGDNARYELAFYDPSGRLTRLARRDVTPQPVTEEDRARIKERDLAQAGTDAEKQRVEEQWSAMPPLGNMPAFESMLTDRLGRIWVTSARVLPTDSATASVYSNDGRWLADVPLPGNFRLNDAGQGWVMGVWRDDVDLEHVRVYGLVEKGEGRREK